MKQLILLFFTSFFILMACNKSQQNLNTSIFYGKWKTSYGDTIQFSRINNKDILTYDPTMSPSQPGPSQVEFSIINNKLCLKDYADSLQYRKIESFA